MLGAQCGRGQGKVHSFLRWPFRPSGDNLAASRKVMATPSEQSRFQGSLRQTHVRGYSLAVRAQNEYFRSTYSAPRRPGSGLRIRTHHMCTRAYTHACTHLCAHLMHTEKSQKNT